MYCESPTKRRKFDQNVEKNHAEPTHSYQNQPKSSSHGGVSSIPAIFKLYSDCCYEIFDYLSLKDIHSIGQTCKVMQSVAGEYFKRNYKSAEKFVEDHGTYTVFNKFEDRVETTVFNPFTKFVSFYGQKQPLCYFKSYIDDFDAITHLNLAFMSLNSIKMESFQSILPTIEVLQIRQCTMWREPSDLHEVLLKYCKNLKRLYIQEDFGYIVNERETSLIRTYPKLEHVEITTRNNTKLPNLRRFFESNPQIRSFATSSHCIWDNRHELMQLPIKLESLEVKHFGMDFYYTPKNPVSIVAFVELLNQLHEKGFYERLHFYVPEVDQRLSGLLLSLRGLEKLTIKEFTQCHELPALKRLKELNIFSCSNAEQLEPMAMGLVNLERLFLQRVSINDILPFIRYSTKLKHLKILSNESANFNGHVIDLQKLNREREKLPWARKVMIYIEDNVFLATKWSTRYGDVDLKMIEMKRSNSICWDDDYSTVRTLH